MGVVPPLPPSPLTHQGPPVTSSGLALGLAVAARTRWEGCCACSGVSPQQAGSVPSRPLALMRGCGQSSPGRGPSQGCSLSPAPAAGRAAWLNLSAQSAGGRDAGEAGAAGSRRRGVGGAVWGAQEGQCLDGRGWGMLLQTPGGSRGPERRLQGPGRTPLLLDNPLGSSCRLGCLRLSCQWGCPSGPIVARSAVPRPSGLFAARHLPDRHHARSKPAPPSHPKRPWPTAPSIGCPHRAGTSPWGPLSPSVPSSLGLPPEPLQDELPPGPLPPGRQTAASSQVPRPLPNLLPGTLPRPKQWGWLKMQMPGTTRASGPGTWIWTHSRP